MKLLVYSDLHLEFSDFSVPDSGYDVAILAGDIHLGERGARWAKQRITDVPVIYICGNHEYYHENLAQVQDAIREELAGTNVYFCENETVEIDGVRFICATLWTDFSLYGNKELNMMQAGYWMNDYHLIQYQSDVLRPQDTALFHQTSRRFVERELKTTPDSVTATVVVTHHAPSARSLKNERIGADISFAYASSLDLLMVEHSPELWIHGHTHESVDYFVGKTRVFSNPRGYSRIADGDGNSNFEPVCIIDV